MSLSKLFKICDSSKTALIATTAIVASLASTSQYVVQCQDEEERNFGQTLKHHRNQLEHYRNEWNWQNAGSRLPTVSWPTNIPDDVNVGALAYDFKFCVQKTNFEVPSKYCQDLQFRIANYMLLQQDIEIQKKGLVLIQQLSESNHADGMCAYATCLNDGRAGLDINPDAAVSWWKHACVQHDHIQSCYEIGVAYYTGEGLPEDEAHAVEYFRRAADCGHAGAAYMLGDCLLDGVGVNRDRGEALEWLVISAELGHRGARSRVLAVLEIEEGKSYGKFTDASRQTLVGNENKRKNSFGTGKERDGVEHQYSEIPATLERRFTIGGGARNPAVLLRRKSIVDESRHDQ